MKVNLKENSIDNIKHLGKMRLEIQMSLWRSLVLICTEISNFTLVQQNLSHYQEII